MICENQSKCKYLHDDLRCYGKCYRYMYLSNKDEERAKDNFELATITKEEYSVNKDVLEDTSLCNIIIVIGQKLKDFNNCKSNFIKDVIREDINLLIGYIFEHYKS